jgi:hypothetical protein
VKIENNHDVSYVIYIQILIKLRKIVNKVILCNICCVSRCILSSEFFFHVFGNLCSEGLTWYGFLNGQLLLKTLLEQKN